MVFEGPMVNYCVSPKRYFDRRCKFITRIEADNVSVYLFKKDRLSCLSRSFIFCCPYGQEI